jgi:hypothetical protein
MQHIIENMITNLGQESASSQVVTLGRISVILGCFEGKSVFHLGQKVERLLTQAASEERKSSWADACQSHDSRSLVGALTALKGATFSKEQVTQALAELELAEGRIVAKMTEQAVTEPIMAHEALKMDFEFSCLVFTQLFDVIRVASPLNPTTLELRLQAVRVLAEKGVEFSTAYMHSNGMEPSHKAIAWKGRGWDLMETMMSARAQYLEARTEYGDEELPPTESTTIAHRSAVLRALEPLAISAQALMIEMGSPMAVGLADEISQLCKSLANNCTIKGKIWSENLASDATLDDIVDLASETILKAKAGKIKSGENDLRDVVKKLSSVIERMELDKTTFKDVLDLSGETLTATKALKLEVKVVKTLQKYPQRQKQREAFLAFQNDFPAADLPTLKRFIQATLYSEYFDAITT